ncbi:uncharacterized protein LOC122044069 [Zingiber officinale]|uniref:uncharacterized protein LOC122044069 n=1 Tax=Zingiber officinale TaxID=94328 RepID=UPI001C4C4027|nr:uncharacterized protein LOC122044069 [Zingiber officinale]
MDMLYKCRQRSTRPSEVPVAVWQSLRAIWDAQHWHHNSAIACNNRNSESAGSSTGSTKHAAGSCSMTTELQRPPTCWEIFNKTHKKKDVPFVDQRSSAINEAMTTMVAEASQPNAEGEGSQPLSTNVVNDIYYDVVGGKKKTSLYGLDS